MEEKSDLTTVNAFPEKISALKAEQTLERTDDTVETAWITDEIYYPYLTFSFQVEASMIEQKDNATIHCGIDLINKKELLIDEMPTFKPKSVTSDQVLPRECNQETAIQIARTYIREIVNRQLKPLRTPTIQHIKNNPAHRLFYIANIKIRDGDILQYAVDSVLGDYHRLYIGGE